MIAVQFFGQLHGRLLQFPHFEECSAGVNRYISYFGGTSEEEDLVTREGQKRAIP
jgi:hypothetical protein